MATGNQYNEHWTLEKCEDFLNEAIKLSSGEDYDFLGEIAKKQGSYKEVYTYITNKFPSLNHLLVRLKSNCEASCFSNGKNGNIDKALAIMNLKSNHGWTDRVETDVTSKGKEVGTNIISFISTDND